MKPYAFGVDVGGTTVKLGLFSTDGTLLEQWEIPTHTEENGARILPEIAQSITHCLTRRGIPFAQVEGIGLGVPGPVNSDGVVNRCINLGWGVFNIKEEMQALLPEISKFAAGNDATVATLGELWQGGAKGCSSTVMLTLGTGVGGGVVIDGKIVPGANGGSGEVGHLTVDPAETRPCACGKRGCLEQYASATGIVRLAHELLEQCDDPSPLRDMDKFTARDICDLARGGDRLALAIVDRCADYLARGISYVACTVDPDVFLIGGGMSRAGSVLLEPTARHYRKYAFHVSTETPILPATLGNDAGIYGCVRMLLE